MKLIKQMEDAYNADGTKKSSGGSSSGGSGSSGGSSSGGSSGTDPSYILPASSSTKLTREQILSLDKSMWAYARNEIYARHGYEFSNSKYRNYFSKKSWYKPGGFSESSLSSTEWYNMKLIQSMEKEFGVN